ncbi:MAG: HAMP domain-containing histidine kinase, partial [Alphaproteobacteria bacterium]|nr:HAMP domain-containing histidine kinase [Alphaproteobacteria bacterium]
SIMSNALIQIINNLLEKRGMAGSLILMTTSSVILSFSLCVLFYWLFDPTLFDLPFSTRFMIIWGLPILVPLVVSSAVSVPLFKLVTHLVQLELELNQRAKEKEILEANNSLKSNFLNAMSMEFRTPLNNIVGFSELLLFFKENFNEKQQGYLSHIQDSGKALSDMINDLLKMSEVAEGLQTTKFEETNLQDMLRDCMGVLSQKAEGRSILLEVHETDEPVLASIDGLGGRRCLMYVAENVLRYSKPNEGLVLRAVQEEGKIVFSILNSKIEYENLEQENNVSNVMQASVSPGDEAGAFAMTKALVEFFGGKLRSVQDKDGIAGAVFDFPIANERS